MSVTFTCTGCGRLTPDDDSGCLDCDLCAGCTPGAGWCFECKELRREDEADRMLRLSREARSW